jgi:hypothetical protein
MLQSTVDDKSAFINTEGLSYLLWANPSEELSFYCDSTLEPTLFKIKARSETVGAIATCVFDEEIYFKGER